MPGYRITTEYAFTPRHICTDRCNCPRCGSPCYYHQGSPNTVAGHACMDGACRWTDVASTGPTLELLREEMDRLLDQALRMTFTPLKQP